MTDEQALAVALLTKPEYQRLYRTSPTFHAHVDLLARMLPAWVAGFAIDAEEIDARHSAVVEELMNRLGPSPMESFLRGRR